MLTRIVEYYYAQKIFPLFNSRLSQLTGSLPFSLAEFIIVGVSCFLLWSIWRIGKFLLKNGPTLQILYRITFKFIVVAGSIYILFLFLWGLNYHRLPFSQTIGLEIKANQEGELEDLCLSLVERSNRLRLLVEENRAGFMIVSSPANVLKRAPLGFANAALDYSQLGGIYGQPKKILLSRTLSYLGIWGIYFPFTGEANVNIAIPASQLPSTVCHEMAHQRGFAREDEANFIAYLVTKYHPDIEFKYSGSLLALVHGMNALKVQNPEAFQVIQAKYGPGLKKDLAEVSNFSLHHQGTAEELATKINNYYLKANNQREGINSYGRMVDLLLAEYRGIPH